MSRIAIAGSSGLVGTKLAERLHTDGHEVVRLVRRKLNRADPKTSPGIRERFWDPQGEPDPAELEGCDAVVNLAGHSIASGPWTESRRRLIRESRTLATRHLADACLLSGVPTLLNASAIGYYGNRCDEWLDEDSPAGGGFLADTCVAWEHAVRRIRGSEVREVRVRFGTILSTRGGALAAMLPVYRLGLGGALGTGQQWISWIHLDDAVAILVRCLFDSTLSGPILAVTPNPIRQKDFARALGAALERPVLITVPSMILRLLLGTMGSELLLFGQRCHPKVLESAGFQWGTGDLGTALGSLLRVGAP